MLSYQKHERVLLKTHPEFDERWLQERIAEDTSILGLGDLVLLERERIQEKAGRLDLLLADPEQNRRYEVEIMLGQTDEAHIIRCIEYWDIERRRYPGYEHCAVLVAEEVTSRFLNVLSLLLGTIPLIVIQLNALQVGDSLVLDFVRVLDQRSLRRDDIVETKLASVDRSYWISRSAEKVVSVIDGLLAIINEKASPQQRLNYNRYYIGLTDGTRSRNFVTFRPRRQFVHLTAEVLEPGPWAERVEEAGLSASVTDDKVQVTVAPADLKKHEGLIRELLHEAVDLHQQE